MDQRQRLNAEMLPFAAVLGIDFVSAVPDRIAARMRVREDLCTRPAVLHGGALMAFADTTTIESKTNFFAPAPIGTEILGEATPLHRGRRTMVWQTRVTNPEGRLLALVTQTQLVL